MTEDEMAGWHHRLNGCEFEQLRELVMDREAWHSWGRRELDTTERLNWTELKGNLCDDGNVSLT